MSITHLHRGGRRGARRICFIPPRSSTSSAVRPSKLNTILAELGGFVDQIAASTHRRIVLTTLGSLGDLHPYLAIALGLQARGYEPVLATSECYRRKIEAFGIGFHPVRPDSDWIGNPNVMQRIMHPRLGTMRAV